MMIATGLPPDSFYWGFSAACILPVIAGAGVLLVMKRKPWAGAYFGIPCCLLGGLLVLGMFATGSGAFPEFWFLSILPLVMGVICLCSWWRRI